MYGNLHLLVFYRKYRQICQSHGSYGIVGEFAKLSLRKHPFLSMAIFSWRPWLKLWHTVMATSSHERTDGLKGVKEKGQGGQGKVYFINADI